MASFGTVLPSDSDVLDGYINGLREANSGFLNALVRYSAIFDHFIFFCGDGDCQSRQEIWDSWLDNNGINEKSVSVLPVQHLPAAIASHSFDLFYSGDPYISYHLELRDAFAEQVFPIVGRTHALSQDIALGAWRSLIYSPSLECDALLASSRASSKVLENLLEEAGRRVNNIFSGQLIQIPLGVDIPDNMPDRVSARESLGLPADGTILLCIGRLSPVDKADLHPLLLALAKLCDQYCVHDTHLYICGQSDSDDDYVLSLVSMAGQLGIDDRVLFNFELSSEQKILAYRACDIFVSLADSVQESFGIAPVEAMAAGLPVVLSDWDGYRELIKAGEHGELIPTCWGEVDGLSAPGAFFGPSRAHLLQTQTVAVDIERLTSALNHLVHNPSVRQEMGRKASDHARQVYGWPEVISRFDICAGDLINKAAQLVIHPSGKLHSLHFGKVFCGYSATQLAQKDCFQTTLYGRQALSGMVLPARYEVLESIVPEALLNKLFLLCLQPCSVKKLRVSLSVARAQTDGIVLWAAKHGLIARKDSSSSCHFEPRYLSAKLIKCDSLCLDEVDNFNELEQQLKDVLSEEERRIFSQVQIKSQPLVLRYIFRRLLESKKAFRLILQRVTDHHNSFCAELFLSKSNVTTICPMTDQNYLGACLIIMENGDRLVYKPASGEIAQVLNAAGGLFDRFNSWSGHSLISFNKSIYCGSDNKGEFSLRAFSEDVGLSPDKHLYDLGLFSAFVLCTGMSDIHLENLKVEAGGLIPVDLDMVCHPEVLRRFHCELCRKGRPERWQDSSLALTRVEILWDELFEQGWMLDEDDVEVVINGFENGLWKVAEHASEWKQLMIPLTNQLCRDDPVPFNSAEPILGQLERFDLSGASSMEDLKVTLASQARRVLRQLESGVVDEALVARLVNSWIKGRHLIGWIKPGKVTERVIREISHDLIKHDGVSISWLSTLYKEWLLKKSGLTE